MAGILVSYYGNLVCDRHHEFTAGLASFWIHHYLIHSPQAGQYSLKHTFTLWLLQVFLNHCGSVIICEMTFFISIANQNQFINIFKILFLRVQYVSYTQAQDYARLSQEVSSRQQWSRGSAGGGAAGSVTAVAEERFDGTVGVGKIIFDPQQLLGKGCDGTFVFK